MAGNVSQLKKEIMSKAGPMGKIVVKKQMKKLGLSGDDVSGSDLDKLIEESVKSAIADSSKHQQIISELKSKLR
ncbi:MAG: hypothetical protein ACOC40_03320 [Thermoplasmatota archaeon]